MFIRFSDRARAAVVEAQAIAHNDGSDAITTAHLQAACLNIDAELRVGVVGPSRGHIPLSVGLRNALAEAAKIAEARGDKYIGVEHLKEAAYG